MIWHRYVTLTIALIILVLAIVVPLTGPANRVREFAIAAFCLMRGLGFKPLRRLFDAPTSKS